SPPRARPRPSSCSRAARWTPSRGSPRLCSGSSPSSPARACSRDASWACSSRSRCRRARRPASPSSDRWWRTPSARGSWPAPSSAPAPGASASPRPPHSAHRTLLEGGLAMSDNGHVDPRTLRSRLSHPIIDADGHWLEYGPVMREAFRKIGGEAAVEGLALASQRVPNALRMTVAERARRRIGQEAFWSSPCENVLDRATAMLPRLLHERLPDLGIDFSVVYPTAGLSYHRMQDTRLRRAICRAYNVFAADQFRGLEDRVIPAAIIPMYTPEEAIEEIEFAATQLGY